MSERQKSFSWFQSRSFARKSACAAAIVLSEDDAFRVFDALQVIPGRAIAIRIAPIATNVRPYRIHFFMPLPPTGTRRFSSSSTAP